MKNRNPRHTPEVAGGFPRLLPQVAAGDSTSHIPCIHARQNAVVRLTPESLTGYLVRAYVFHCGFLDGWRGYCITCMTAAYTYLRYGMAYEQQSAAPKK